MPNYSLEDYKQMGRDDYFKVCKRKDFKLIYNLWLEGREKSSQNKMNAKILKLDKNN